jgi:hypothetical protein
VDRHHHRIAAGVLVRGTLIGNVMGWVVLALAIDILVRTWW